MIASSEGYKATSTGNAVASGTKKQSFFCRTKGILAVRSNAAVVKTDRVWRKTGVFGPDSVPPDQL